MAENNSSAPLKTAPMIEAFEAAYSRDWNDPAGDEIKEIWHRAWQEAAAAQAPAAVAVSDDLIELAMLNKLIDLGSEAAYESAKSSSDDGPKGTAAFVRWQELRANMRALIHTTYPGLATPALPATEDSSAGDLPEVQAEPVAWINHPVIVDCAGNFAGYGNPELSFKRPASGFAFDKAQALYTAPQAQPADALDAELLELVRATVAFSKERGSVLQVHIDNMADLLDERDAAMAAAQEGGKA